MPLGFGLPAVSERPDADGADGTRSPRLPFLLLGFCLSYLLAAKLGIATSMPPEGIVILWPPNALVLGILVLFERKDWWLVFVATVASEVVADVPDYPLWAAIGYGIVNFSEAAIAAALLQKLTRRAPPLVDLWDFLGFVAIGPVLASGTAALFGAFVYKIGAPEIDYLHYWRVFWLGDALGLLTIGTALLAWKRPDAAPAVSTLPRAAEAVALASGLLAVAVWGLLAEAEAPRVYLIFPFLAWAGLRFGVRGTSVAVLAVAAIAIASAVMGQGPFAELSRVDAVVALQGLIAVVALSSFMLAFSTEASLRTRAELHRSIEHHRKTEVELRRAWGELNAIKQDLDGMVADRTAHLRRAVARNEMLLREVHHRVKNNLQLVSSLLRLHGRAEASPELSAKFADVEGQISAIAAIYDMMQQTESAESVDFSAVLAGLCGKIQQANGGLVTITVDTSGEAPVSADTAVALSLAINELITNSIKHAADDTVAVSVACRREADSLVIGVADDGPGFPPGFEIADAEGFGMRMARSLVDQVEGRMRAAPSSSGAAIEIRVPARPEREAHRERPPHQP